MSELLIDRVAIVTGAASGNGRAIARTFAEHGANVVCADVRSEPRLGGTPTHERIAAETDAEAVFIQSDVTEKPDLREAVDAALDLGGIDVMVNNAGIYRHNDDIFAMSDINYAETMDINVKGVFLGAQVAAESMLENGGGSIINLSSINGDRGTSGDVIYCASKGAVKTMTYALADALGPKIRVNAIHPGSIETAQTLEDYDALESEQRQKRIETIPLNRIGRPEDVANTALFLASDLADYVTAESLVVDGGMINTR